MSSELLNKFVSVRRCFQNPKHKQGEISGTIEITAETIPVLQVLAANDILEDMVVVNGLTVTFSQLKLTNQQTLSIQLTIYPKKIIDGLYYETLNDYVVSNQYAAPSSEYYIFEKSYHSITSSADVSITEHEDVIAFLDILTSLADYVEHEIGEPKNLILFHKKKINIPLRFNANALRSIPFLNRLKEQFSEVHDSEERKTVFKNELVNLLVDLPEKERLITTLTSLDSLFDNYLKSHLLYVEKFSYHDLKSEVDKDKLDYTKKIYGTVNDIQTKLIAVPAAFLLVLSQFDFTGVQLMKNIFIGIGAVLFAILMEILLRNQFDLLKYIKREILHFTNELKNKDTTIDLKEFINSFGDLEPIMQKQTIYLQCFRLIIWSVPVVASVMILCFRK